MALRRAVAMARQGGDRLTSPLKETGTTLMRPSTPLPLPNRTAAVVVVVVVLVLVVVAVVAVVVLVAVLVLVLVVAVLVVAVVVVVVAKACWWREGSHGDSSFSGRRGQLSRWRQQAAASASGSKVCAQQYVGKSQSCMVITSRLLWGRRRAGRYQRQQQLCHHRCGCDRGAYYGLFPDNR